MQASIAMAILETVHHLLQSHVDTRAGSESMRTLSELLDRALHGHKSLHFAFRTEGISRNDEQLPDSSVCQELCRLFLREGLRDLVILPSPGAGELAHWIDILRTHYRRRVACDAEQRLQPRLVSADFHHLKFGFSLTRRLQSLAGEFGPRLDPGNGRGWMTWEEEALLEARRQLDMDFGLTLLEDLDNHPENKAWPTEGVRILGELLEHLVTQKRYRSCLPILDQAIQCRIPGVSRAMESCLDLFRATNRLEQFLDALSTGFDPALSDFMKRLGPGVAPFLLSQEEHYPSASLHALLEHFLKEDPKPFQKLLSCGNSKIERRALSYLLESGQALPVDLLEDLTRSDTEWIQDRALQLLVAQHPTWLSEDKAMQLLEDDVQSNRIHALRRIRKDEKPEHAKTLQLWFDRKQRKMGFAERKEAFLTLGACLGPVALDFLQPFLDIETVKRRRSDLDNMLCAILALGALHDGKAHDMLVELSQSTEEAVQNMALQVLEG
jgi:hypothetical protein